MDPYKRELERLILLYEEVPNDSEINESDNNSTADLSVENLTEYDTDSEQEYLPEEEDTKKILMKKP